MIKLVFRGYSDDTFGEVNHFHIDYDNCATDKPIEYLVYNDESVYRDWETDRKSTRLNSSHRSLSRMPSSA